MILLFWVNFWARSCLLSEGNCTVQVGLVQLYALVMSLERDHEDRLRGVSIEYGDEMKNYKKIAQTLGWSKKSRTRRSDIKNDGRPPDTTDALLGKAKKKLGRPKGAVNINQNPITTYQSYTASNVPGRKFRCWLNTMTECLYALHTPLWYSRSKGQSTHIFSKLMKHFSSRTTWEIGQKGKIKTILTMGQNTLHAAIEECFPNCFLPDTYSSADLYFEGLFNDSPERHAPTPPGMASILFRMDHRRKLVCSQDPSHRTFDMRTIDTIVISHETFKCITEPPMTYEQTPQLLNLWASDHGLQSVSARICKQCPQKKDKTDPASKDPPAPPPMLEQSRLGNDKSPPHLHIHLEVGFYLDSNPEEAAKMMQECDLPYEIILNDHTYRMRARGFWGNSHYWCKVVRNVGGVTGVWLHNDLQNSGLATLLSTDLETIGGQSPKTSWAMYSRAPTAEEEVIIKSSQAKINQSVGTKGAAAQPFSQIKDDYDEVWEDYKDEEGSTRDQGEEEEDRQETINRHHCSSSANAIDEQNQRDVAPETYTGDSVHHHPGIRDMFNSDHEAEVTLARTGQTPRHGEGFFEDPLSFFSVQSLHSRLMTLLYRNQ